MEKSFLVSIIAVFAVLTLVTCVSAGDLASLKEVTINGVDYHETGGDTVGIEAGETLPIKIVFQASIDAEEVKVKAWIDGYRSEIVDKTERFELVKNSVYTKYLSLDLPSDIDPTEDYTLVIRISDKTESDEAQFDLKLQRSSYSLAVLSAEAPGEVTAGSVVAIDVVLKNKGMHKLEDIYVKASIPDLGTEKKVYFGDLYELDEGEYDIVDDTAREANRKDAIEGRIYLVIPDNAKAGIYGLEIEAYNVESIDLVRKSIVISGVEGISNVLSGASVKSLSIGQEVTYDFVIVNSGDKMKVYTFTPEEAKGLIVEVEPIVTVSADSSKTVKVKVRATESAEEGTHIVTVNVESEGELIRQIAFSANVEKGKVKSSIAILTVILAIIFIVLLIILIVLLTKKPTVVETEEGEETSYY